MNIYVLLSFFICMGERITIARVNYFKERVTSYIRIQSVYFDLEDEILHSTVSVNIHML